MMTLYLIAYDCKTAHKGPLSEWPPHLKKLAPPLHLSGPAFLVIPS